MHQPSLRIETANLNSFPLMVQCLLVEIYEKHWTCSGRNFGYNSRIVFLISKLKHMLWVLVRSASPFFYELIFLRSENYWALISIKPVPPKLQKKKKKGFRFWSQIYFSWKALPSLSGLPDWNHWCKNYIFLANDLKITTWAVSFNRLQLPCKISLSDSAFLKFSDNQIFSHNEIYSDNEIFSDIKGSIFLINRHFIIKERFNKLIYGISTFLKCGTW